MPAVRRSSSRLIANAAAPTVIPQEPEEKTKITRKRKAAPNSVASTTKAVETSDMIDVQQESSTASTTTIEPLVAEPPETFVPAVLSFDFEEAKRHLIQVDQRFGELFAQMKCKPFEHLERVHPFRALATSILGQQISWLAARSITHKFIRLFDQSIPEQPDEEERKSITSFPTPFQVSNTDIATLRTAGLSARKAEYIRDLAARFADGRLSTKKLLEADDDELARMLIEVRGIGRWTVDMFAIFSLRRPDILPVGDLGVQRGLVRWFLSLHSPVHTYSISPEKVGGTATPKKKSNTADKKRDSQEQGPSTISGTSNETEGLPSIPPAFTPSINKTLNNVGGTVVPLPPGVDVGVLKVRLDGKKKIKGAFLTPQEMNELTECWKPYRSLGVYYMWSLAD